MVPMFFVSLRWCLFVGFLSACCSKRGDWQSAEHFDGSCGVVVNSVVVVWVCFEMGVQVHCESLALAAAADTGLEVRGRGDCLFLGGGEEGGSYPLKLETSFGFGFAPLLLSTQLEKKIDRNEKCQKKTKKRDFSY